MPWADEVRAAIGGLTPIPLRGATPADRSGGLAYYPAVGLAIGAVGAGAAWAIAHLLGPPVSAVTALAMLEIAGALRGRAGIAAAAGLMQGGSADRRLAAVDGPIGTAGWVAAVATLAVKLGAAVRMTVPALLAATLLAPLLGRWAMVVEAHGGRTAFARGDAVGVVGGAGFREFGAASVFTFLVLMGVGQAIGLLLLVTAALVTLGWRVLVHRRLGGFTGALLAAAGELVETVVFVVLGSLPALGR